VETPAEIFIMSSFSPEGGPQNDVDPEGRRRLAELLEAERDAITQRWEAEACRELGVDGSSHASLTLNGAVADYLTGLAGGLRMNARVTVGAAAAWRGVSERHDLTSARRGFDVADVVKQLVALRKAILGVMRVAPPAHTTPEVQTDLVADLIDAGITQVVASYIHNRDQQARQLRAEYIGFVTHELRNPLTTAMLAAGRLDGESSPSSPRALELMQRNLKRVATLIETFLLTEQMEADRIHPHPIEILVGELMAAAVDPALHAAHRPEVRLRVSVDPALLVKVDPTLTIAALQNVLTKAVQFTDKGLVSIEAEDRKERVILHVRDNCVGLDPEALATIFEPFSESHPGKPVPGLGLALARRVMEEQGGSIDVESEGGGGCHFRIALPKPSAGRPSRSSGAVG
jgi:signal transduction histidine kinase